MPGWGGGANLAAAVNQLAPDEALGLANVILDEQGGGAKRRGLTFLSDPGAEVISEHVFYRGAASPPQVLIHQADGKVRYTTDLTNWTDILTGTSVVNPMCFETFNQKVYMGNGVDPIISWDGSTQAAVASAPEGKYLKVWKDTMWIAGTDNDRVWSSDPGNAEAWTVGNWVDLGKGDGDSITGLATDGNALIVPKHRRAFLIYDPTTFANRIFDPDKGAESHFGWVHYGENLYYFSRDGICIYLGDSPSQIISGKIDPIFRDDVLNFEKTNLVWAYVHNNRIGWTVPEAGSGVPSLQIELLPRSEKRPFTFHRMPIRCFATLRLGTTEQLLGGKNGDRFVEVFKGGTDDGTPFVGVIETGWYDMENPILFKYLRRMVLQARGQFFVSVLRDYESAIRKTIEVDLSDITSVWNEPGGVWGDENWGPSVVLETIPLHPDEYGRQFKFRFSDASDEEGTQTIDVGDVDYALERGNWAVYGGTMEGVLMGTSL